MSKKASILKEYEEKIQVYRNFGKAVEYLLSTLIYNEGVICNSITHRIKDKDSLGKKIDIKNMLRCGNEALL